MPVDVMPGPSDPSNHSLPQQPLHECLLPGSAGFATLNRCWSQTWRATPPAWACNIPSATWRRLQTCTDVGHLKHAAPAGTDQLALSLKEVVGCSISIAEHAAFKALRPQVLRRVTNPHDFEVDGVHFLGTSGQNLDDVYRCSLPPACS